MQSGIQRTVLILVAIIAIIMGLSVARVLRTPELDPLQLIQLGVYLRENPTTISEFALVDQQGNAFTNEALKGQWSVLFFGYTYCPDICPITMSQMAKVKAAITPELDANQQLRYVLVSVDPARDTPERLKDYVSYFDPSFVGVTGELQNIYDFAIGLNAIFAKVPLDEEGDYLVDHSGNLVLVSPQGEYFGFIKPPFKVDTLVTALTAIVNR